MEKLFHIVLLVLRYFRHKKITHIFKKNKTFYSIECVTIECAMYRSCSSLTGKLNVFRYIMVHEEKLFTTYFNDDTL